MYLDQPRPHPFFYSTNRKTCFNTAHLSVMARVVNILIYCGITGVLLNQYFVIHHGTR